MVFKRPGKSRDDKSARSPKSTPKGDDAKRQSAPSRSRTSARGDQQDNNRPFKKFEKPKSGDKKPFAPRGERSFGPRADKPAGRGKREFDKEGRPKREGDYSRSKPNYKERSFDRPKREEREHQPAEPQAKVMRGRKKVAEKDTKDNGLIRLNRYIANAGICSRRKADELIEAGVISVNGEVVSELGFKVDPAKDVVRYNGETLKREKMVYVLLNKPKDYITTTDDPQERRTVMQLVEKASKERIYPVGRLDRNTTGLLLMTNDGELADKLSHPRSNVVKLYQAELNKSLTQGDLNKLTFGVELEDGFIKPDSVAYVQGGSKREIGIQIHSGKNRIVRRIFEHLGYEVVKLDRVVYAGLTKKDLPRGRWRYLEEKELIQLKHLL